MKIIPNCPYCGSKDLATHCFTDDYDNKSINITCCNCHLSGPSKKYLNEAIEAWMRITAIKKAPIDVEVFEIFKEE